MPRRHAYRRGASSDAIQPRRISRFLEPALLLLLHRQPSHGYGLIEDLDRLGMGAYPADASAIYRVLYDLEGAGMVTSSRDVEQTAGPPRRVYELTEKGEAYLTDWVQELQETDRLLHRFLDAFHEHVDGNEPHEHRVSRIPKDKEGTL